MPARLVSLDDDHPVELTLGATNTVGRHPDSTIRLDDRGISVEHCRITRDTDGRYVVRDLGSKNGTWVNDSEVAEAVLDNGDELRFATRRFRFVSELDHTTARQTRVQLVPGGFTGEIRTNLESAPGFASAGTIMSLDRLRADYEKLRAAHELASIVSVGLDLDVLLQRIVDEAFRVLSADRAVILLWEDEPPGPGRF